MDMWLFWDGRRFFQVLFPTQRNHEADNWITDRQAWHDYSGRRKTNLREFHKTNQLLLAYGLNVHPASPRRTILLNLLPWLRYGKRMWINSCTMVFSSTFSSGIFLTFMKTTLSWIYDTPRYLYADVLLPSVTSLGIARTSFVVNNIFGSEILNLAQ